MARGPNPNALASPAHHIWVKGRVILPFNRAVEAAVEAAEEKRFVLEPSTVFALVECHRRFMYDPKRHTSPAPADHGEEQREYYTVPHLMNGKFIQKCMEKDEIYRELQEHIFETSGLNEWMKERKVNLLKEYGEIGKKVIIKEKEEVKSLKYWRRMLVPWGLGMEAAHLRVASILLDKVLLWNQEYSSDNHSAVPGYRWMSSTLANMAKSHMLIMQESYLKGYANWTAFEEVWKKLDFLVYQQTAVANARKAPLQPLDFPKKVRRIFWVVRHAQREDNKKEFGTCLEKGKIVFLKDNSPLSEEGKLMASKMAPIFQSIPINHFFCSPYDRTTDTATLVLGENHKDAHNELKIKVEPAFLESLRKCDDVNGGPSFSECKDLHEKSGYKRLDLDYVPIMDKELLLKCHGKENDEDDGCVPRVVNTWRQLFIGDAAQQVQPHPESPRISKKHSPGNKRHKAEAGDAESPLERENIGETADAESSQPESKPSLLKNKYDQSELVEQIKRGSVQSPWLAPHEEDAEHIVIVTHATMYIAIQQLFGGKYSFGPQLSPTKIVEFYPSDDTGHSEKMASEKKDEFRNFRQIYGSVTEHLVKIRVAELFHH